MLIEAIRHYFTPRRGTPPDFARAISTAKICVGILENWNDFEADIIRMTQGGSCLWDDVAFVPLRHCPHPDFILVLNAPRKKATFTIPANRLWFASGEPPVPYYRRFHSGQGDLCHVIANDESEARQNTGRTYFLEPPILPAWSVNRNLQQLSDLKTVEKSRNLSWVTSNLTLLEGHKIRMKFLKVARQKIDFDLYGRGFTSIKDKWDGIAPYHYSIAFENTPAPRYFTEKIMDCFVCHTMPFYFGAPDISKYFPPESMVLISPDDPMVFDKIREISASSLAQERMSYILEAKELCLRKYNMFSRLAAHFATACSRPPLPAQTVTVIPVRGGL